MFGGWAFLVRAAMPLSATTKTLAGVVGGSVDRQIGKKISIIAKLVTDRLGGVLGLVEREYLAARPSVKLCDDGRGFWLVAADKLLPVRSGI